MTDSTSEQSQKPKAAIGPKHILTFLLSAGLLWGLSFYTQQSLAGEKPTVHYNPSTHAQQKQVLDPALLRLEKVAKASPDDLAIWKEYVKALNAAEPKSQKIFLNLIDANLNILRLSPDDTETLLALAELSFQRRNFDDSKAYYERYLEIESEDVNVQARYASVLSFVGEADRAILVLEEIVEKDPEHFQALAYLAISYAQQGERDKAKAVGEKALPLAPAPEARARFSQFLNSLEAPITEFAELSKAQAPLKTFLDAVAANPVAGQKLKGYASSETGILALAFQQFPMAQMPPFAKEKFFSGLQADWEKLGIEEISEIHFYDFESGRLMDRLRLQ